MHESFLSPGSENAERCVLHQRHLFRCIHESPGIVHVDGAGAVPPTSAHANDGKCSNHKNDWNT